MSQGVKWTFDIVFYAPGMPFDGNTPKEKGLGGSETAVIYLSKELAKLGNNVMVFSNCETQTKVDNVIYTPIQNFLKFAIFAPHDVLIIERDLGILKNQFNTKLVFLHMHDLMLKRVAGNLLQGAWNVDRFMPVSKFHKNQLQRVLGNIIPEDFFYILYNGIDLADFPQGLSREPGKFVISTRPERGLDIMLEMWEKVKAEIPEGKLYVAMYDNFVPHLQELYNHCAEIMRRNEDSIIRIGSLSKPKLYSHFTTAEVVLYPTNFLDTFCITALEAQAAGTPMITSNIASGLDESTDENVAIRIQGDARTEIWQKKFIEELKNLLADRQRWQKFSEAGKERVKNFTWEKSALEFHKEIEKIFAERTSDKLKLAKHFVYRSEIFAAWKALELAPESEEKTKLLERLNKDWGFIKNKIDTKAHYELIGDDTNLEAANQVPLEPRWRALTEFLSKHSEIKKIMDFGCAFGNYTIHLSNAFPELEIIGVTLSDSEILWANKHKELKAKNKERIQFSQGDEDNLPEIAKDLDAVLIFETLEHVPDPKLVIDKIEKTLRPGGWVLITVPVGPWEAMSYDTYPHRCHVHEISRREIRDLFENKVDLFVQLIEGGFSNIGGETLGWFFIAYRKSIRTTGEINWKRKLAIQSPRETLALCMITKDCENTVLNAIKSCKPFVDEIIICDTGSKDFTRYLVEKYATKVVDFKWTGSFEEARNESIKHTNCDWILWIDSDEQLLEQINLRKYLRPNMFDGFSIRQHHFSAIPPNAFPPDLPVRVFRNHKGIQFYGVVHEHPERKMNESVGPTIVLPDIEIAHFGYLTESIRRQRFIRNLPLVLKDREKYPDRILGKFFEIRDSIHQVRFGLEQNGGRFTEEMKNLCENVVKLYHDNFLEARHIVADLAFEYYSQACRFLNKGIGVTFAMEASPFEQPVLNGRQKQGWFYSVEHYQKYMKAKTDIWKDVFEGEFV